MFSGVKKTASACWKPVQKYMRMSLDDNEGSSNPKGNDNSGSFSRSFGGNKDPLLWSRELERHFLGEYSFAVYQANNMIEDHSQVEVGRSATFVGVYDGHGGPEASQYVSEHLFANLMRLARNSRTMSENVIRGALAETENGFLTLVSSAFSVNQAVAAIGSCCLVGVIWQGTLYVANLGDSRAVIGSLNRSNKISAEQLTQEHNACMEEVRQELRSAHPDDSTILVMKEGVWRIKGIIQVSRSIGDGYLKSPDLALDSSHQRFHFSEPIRRPILTAEPSVHTRVLEPKDKFLIFASDGLWEHLTNQEAVEIVHRSRRVGIAKKLVEKALKKVAERRDMTFKNLKKVKEGDRRNYHDDITVVVIFLDHELLSEQTAATFPEVSVQGFVDTTVPSQFTTLHQTS